MSALAEKLMTFEEYLCYDDGTDNRYELIDGELAPMALPTIRHALLADFIREILKNEIRRLNKSWICLQEMGVRTGIRKSRVTDVCVLTTEQTMDMINEEAVFDTPPLLAVEVVSADSVQRDYRHKRSEYATLGIPEYWIIDPLKTQVSVLLLEYGFYDETVFKEKPRIISPTFTELSLTVEQIFALGR